MPEEILTNKIKLDEPIKTEIQAEESSRLLQHPILSQAGVGSSVIDLPRWNYVGSKSWISTTDSQILDGLPSADLFLIVYRAVNNFAGASNLTLQLNRITAGNYNHTFIIHQTGATSTLETDTVATAITLNQMQAQDDVVVGEITIQGKHNNGIKSVFINTGGKVTANARKGLSGALVSDSNNLTSITLVSTQISSGRADIYKYDLRIA